MGEIIESTIDQLRRVSADIWNGMTTRNGHHPVWTPDLDNSVVRLRCSADDCPVTPRGLTFAAARLAVRSGVAESVLRPLLEQWRDAHVMAWAAETRT